MTIVLLVFLSLVSLGLLFWQISNIISIIFGSPAVMMDRATIIKTLKSVGPKKGETIFDLGCGNGQVLIEANKLGLKAVGFEISPLYYIWAKIRIFFFKIRNSKNIIPSKRSSNLKGLNNRVNDVHIKVVFQNIKNIDLSKADLIYCYLLPGLLEKMAPKFKRLKKTRIISVGFPIPNLKLLRHIKTQSHNIFLYR